MADNIKRKRVTLHPLKADGSVDTTTNLYPKTFVDGIVDREGNEVDIATQDELAAAVSDVMDSLEVGLDTKQDTLIAGENIKTINGNSLLGEGDIEVATDLSNYVDRSSDQEIGGDKTFEDVTTHNDNVIFNKDIFVRGNLVDQESNVIPVKNISLANNLENGTGNGSLIQTNTVLSEHNDWSSSDEEVAIVDENGNIEAIAPGEATITVIHDGAEATCDITVSPRPFLLGAAPGSDIGLDDYEILTDVSDISSEDEIYLIYVNGSTRVQFNKVNGTIGAYTDIVEGEALLVPLTFNKIDDTENEFTITYDDSGSTKYLYWNSTAQQKNNLNAGSDRDPTSRWLVSFSGTTAAIVNKADEAGSRRIQYNQGSPRFAVYANNQQQVKLVKAIRHDPIESFTLDEHELTLESGEIYQLLLEILPETASQKVTWASSDTDVVTVDALGNLEAALLNVTSTATITVTSVDEPSFSDTCEVTVKKQAGPAIRLSSSRLKLRAGDTAQLFVKYAQTNVASGDLAIALGHSNAVSGNNSVAIGSELVSSYDDQVVIGKYNYNKNNTLFEVGNGTSETRSNALEVHADGSVRAYKAPTNSNDLTNKNYVDNHHDSSKQDALVSGTNIKTINGNTILGSGDVTISGGTTVIPNPELIGDEDNLSSVQIGDTKYRVDGGSSGDVLELTTLEVNRIFRTPLETTIQINHGSFEWEEPHPEDEVWTEETNTIKIIPDIGYKWETTYLNYFAETQNLTVYSHWDSRLSLYPIEENPVSIEATCQTLEGRDIIQVDALQDGTIKHYEILKTDNQGNALVFPLDDSELFYITDQENPPTTESVDLLLNETYYNSLPDIIKNNIIEVARKKSTFSYSGSATIDPEAYIAIYQGSVSQPYRNYYKQSEISLGNKKVFALDITDIFDLFLIPNHIQETLPSTNHYLGDYISSRVYFNMGSRIYRYSENDSFTHYYLETDAIDSSYQNNPKFYFSYYHSGSYGILVVKNNAQYSEKTAIRPAFWINIAGISSVIVR